MTESDEAFRAMADRAPVLIWMSGLNNEGVYFNRPWLEFTGRTLEQEMGDGWVDAIHPDDRAYTTSTCSEALRNGIPFSMQFRMRRADGQYRWIVDTGLPRFHADGTLLGFIGSCVDITEQHIHEDALRDSEERLRLATESTGLGSWDYQPLAGTLQWSARCKDIFSLPHDIDATYQIFLDALHPDDRAQTDAAVQAALESGSDGKFAVDYRVIGITDGAERWVQARGHAFFDEHNRAVRLIGTVLEVTDQKHAEMDRIAILKREQEARALAESAQKRSEFLAEASAVLSSSLDYEATLAKLARMTTPYIADYCMFFQLQPDGDLRQVAHAHATAEHESYLELHARTYRMRMDHPTSAAVKAIKTSMPVFLPDISIEDAYRVTSDPQLIEIFQHLSPRSSISVPILARGEVLGVLQLNMSVSGRIYDTDLLKLAEELAQRAATAMDNARLYHEAQHASSAKDKFLAVLSHELRTPLTPALAAVQALQEEDVPEDTRFLLEIIQRNIELEARLIDDLLDLTRIIKGKLKLDMETIDLHTIIRHVLDIVATDISAKHQEFSVTLAAEHHHVRGDSARLQQVLWNVMKNAIKFTPEQGSITLTTRSDGNRMFIDVVDNGIGIDAAILPLIFNAFEQGEDNITQRFGGLGLGLAISRLLMTMHDGSIEAASEGPGRGATFTISMPVATAPLSGNDT